MTGCRTAFIWNWVCVAANGVFCGHKFFFFIHSYFWIWCARKSQHVEIWIWARVHSLLPFRCFFFFSFLLSCMAEMLLWFLVCALRRSYIYRYSLAWFPVLKRSLKSKNKCDLLSWSFVRLVPLWPINGQTEYGPSEWTNNHRRIPANRIKLCTPRSPVSVPN